MTALGAIVVKEVRLLLRDPGGVIMLFVLPALFIVILSVALDGAFSANREGDRLGLVIVDEDDGVVAAEVAEGVADSTSFRLVDDETSRGLDRAAAVAGLERRSWDVVVMVPPGAADALDLDGRATVEVLLDPVVSTEIARAAEGVVRGALLAATIRGLRDRLASLPRAPGSDEADLEEEEEEEEPGLEVVQAYATSRGGDGQERPTSVQQSVPGWTIFALFWLSQILALNIISERTSGIHARLVASPASEAVQVAGKIVPFFLINLLQAVAMFAVGVLVLPRLGCPRLEIANVPALLLLTLAVSLVSVAFGLVMAALFRSAFFVATVTAAILIIMTVLGGIMVPRYVMPEVMQRLTLFVPHGWALDGYLDVLVRGASVVEILPQVGALLAFAAGLFAVAAARNRLGGR